MYEEIKKGDTVVFKEGRIFDWCEVIDISVDSNNGGPILRKFKLQSRLNSDYFDVSICDGTCSAYVGWEFVPASRLTNFDY